MGLTRWILALCGYVRLEVCGVHPERVLNACAAAGIASAVFFGLLNALIFKPRAKP